MNLSKPINPIRNYALGSTITALILLSPVLAFLMVIATETLIDLLMVGGTSVICAVAAGGTSARDEFLAAERHAAVAAVAGLDVDLRRVDEHERAFSLQLSAFSQRSPAASSAVSCEL